MLITVKYFIEQNEEDFNNFTKIWAENKDRFIILQPEMPVHTQNMNIKNCLYINNKKDILVIRGASDSFIKTNNIINNIISGRRLEYPDCIWAPKEIWIYNTNYNITS